MILGRLQARLWHIHLDSATLQLELARAFFGPKQIVQRLQRFVGSGDARRVVFSEQALTALQRLVLLHAGSSAEDRNLNEAELLALRRSVLAMANFITPEPEQAHR